MEFAKLQGTGNDFVLVDARGTERDWPALARSICQRRLGVGADGLLLLLSSETAALRLRMFNPDGSEAEACGNGLRCFARYATERGLVDGAEFGVETMAGTRAVRVLGDGSVTAEMGVPRFAPADIPANVQAGSASNGGPVSDYPVRAAGRELRISCVSMGNPHAVCFIEQNVGDFPLDEIGPGMEHHEMFPNRVNFEIVNVVDRRRLRARVWERGAGETLSCGSGVCAVAVVSMQKGLCDSPVDVEVPGGTLNVGWDGEGEVLLTGPAETVFVGEWES